MRRRVAAAALVAAAASAAPPKNVLFLSVDDLRPQTACTSLPGADKPKAGMHTPNICRLAAGSLVLERSQVAMATCSPSRTAMLTGRHPRTTHVWDLYSYFRNVTGNFTTIPQYFKEAGYFSTGMGKIFHPGVASGGGDCAVCTGADDAAYSWSEPYFHGDNPVDKDKAHSWVAVPANVTAQTPLQDTQVMQHAVDTLKRVAKRDQPFFVAVGFHKPHLPFVFPEEFLAYYPEDVGLPANPYAPAGMPAVAWQGFGETRGYGDVAALHCSGKPNVSQCIPDAVTLQLRRAYYAAVSYTDYNIGQVLDALDATGKADDTVISFWGDHGWQLGEHGEWDKHTNFAIATHAPVMFRVPGRTDAGISSFALTETVDIFPTLVDLALGRALPVCPSPSVGVTTCTEGVSLAPLLDKSAGPVKEAALSVYTRGPQSAGGSGELGGAAGAGLGASMSTCLSGGPKGEGCTMGYSMWAHAGQPLYRYTEWVEFPGPASGFCPNWDQNVGTELYNLTADPEENVNVAARFADLSKQLSATLRKLSDPQPRSTCTPPPPAPPTPPPAPPPPAGKCSGAGGVPGVASGNGKICCAAECGECGGPSCGARPGGNTGCCTGKISDSGKGCAQYPPPCTL